MSYDLSKQLLCMRCMHIDDVERFPFDLLLDDSDLRRTCPSCGEDEMLVNASKLVFTLCHDCIDEVKLTREGDPICVECMVNFGL